MTPRSHSSRWRLRMNGNVLAHLSRRLTAAGSRRAAVRMLAGSGLSALGIQGRHEVADARDRCPRGDVRKVSDNPKQVEITFRAHKGLASVSVTRSENADTHVPPFTAGTTDPVVVSSTRIDQTQRARVQVKTTNERGV